MLRSRTLLPALVALAAPLPAHAQQSGFDLDGPDLVVAVERGGERLPIAAVPALKEGDRLTVAAALPADQSARYMLVLAFLRGATNPPPKDWFFRAETWQRKRGTLDVVVPKGADRAVLFLAPETGGGFDAVRDAVRGRPGVFVRAAQDLHQASLDRARLDAFVGAVGRIGDAEPERLAAVAPALAETLRIKLNAECLSRPRSLQAACLTQNRDGLILQAQRGATWTETLTGAPVDLAYRVAATPEGGAGYYSPYIGLARDLGRLLGAFRTAQYQYVPSLALGRGERLHLQLNTAPSFQNPRSVLVAPLPPIGPAPLPAWRVNLKAPACLARPDLTLPLDDAALLFATDYARDLTLRVTAADGRTAELPVRASAEDGGVRVVAGDGIALGSVTGGVLHGRWGFDRFTGPRVPVQLDAAGAWKPVPDARVVVGREQPLVLRGGAAACVSSLALRGAGNEGRDLAWKSGAPDEIATALPLAQARPGPMTLLVARYGTARPDAIALTATLEASRLDRLVLHAGDRGAVLEGARLDQVAALEVAGTRFVPAGLARTTQGDRLDLTAEAAVAAKPGDAVTATVRSRDGGVATLAATVAEPRPSATLGELRVDPAGPPPALPIALADGLVPVGAALTFSLRRPGGFAAGDAVEVGAGEGPTVRLAVADGTLQRVGDDAGIATVDTRAFGPAAIGPIRYRLWHGAVAGDWQPLARLVRLPLVDGVACAASGSTCRLSGRGLFALAAIAEGPDFAGATAIDPGFVGGTIEVPRPRGPQLYLRLRDAPDARATLALPAPG